MRIGVLSLQGSFSLHIKVLNNLGVTPLEIRTGKQLSGIDGLIIPGGESTTFTLLLEKFHMREPIVDLINNGLPVWGTCAGAIILGHGTEIPQPRLELMDVEVTRNAFGRQVDSFVQSLQIEGFKEPFPGVFIRAPRFYNPGKRVHVLSELNSEAVMLIEDKKLLTSFHPELTSDKRVHEYFVNKVCAR